MNEYPCDKSKTKLCIYGGNKRYDYGFVSGMLQYCRKIKKWVHDIEICPLEDTMKCVCGGEKLKPCPFCGAGWMITERMINFVTEKIPKYEKGYRVNCNTGCNAKTTWWHTREQAIKAWNRRTQ